MGVSARTDTELVLAVCAGDERAFTVLYNRYHTGLQWFLIRRGIAEAQAEDMAQETFFRAAKHLASFNPAKKFRTWLFTIAVRLSINAYRDNARRTRLFVESDDEPYDAETQAFRTEDISDCHNVEFRVYWAAAQLAPAQHAVFTARAAGMPYDEIARQLKMPMGTVKSTLLRARERVREMMDSPEAHAAFLDHTPYRRAG